MIDLKDKTLSGLERIVVDLGQKKYLARYIFQFIHAENATQISQITPLSKAFREQLAREDYMISRLTLSSKRTDSDGTSKYVFTFDGGHRIETVLLPDDKRRTLCVSTQAGCAMGCSFCATARIGFKTNLTAGQIVDQVNMVCSVPVRALRNSQATKTPHGVTTNKISNVVFMGMGEPLANYDATIKSIGILNHPAGKNSSRERIAQFASVLDRAGIKTTVRFRMGRSIKAARGQLGADWLDN